MLVWEEDMVKALRKEGESLREENARLAALVQQYHPAYLGLPHVALERDEARAKLARCVEVAKSSPLVSYTPVDGEAIRVVPVSVVLAAVKGE